jgi:hypothetical protein
VSPPEEVNAKSSSQFRQNASVHTVAWNKLQLSEPPFRVLRLAPSPFSEQCRPPPNRRSDLAADPGRAPLDRLPVQQLTGTVQRLRGLGVLAGRFSALPPRDRRRQRPVPLHNARRDLLRILFVFMARTSSALLRDPPAAHRALQGGEASRLPNGPRRVCRGVILEPPQAVSTDEKPSWFSPLQEDSVVEVVGS